MAKIKVKKYQGCSNIDISKAILELSKNLLDSCKDNIQLQEIIITLGITAWNISLYEAENNDYSSKIKEKIPKGFSEEYNLIFENFIAGFIKEKQGIYPDLLKGITSHKYQVKDGKRELIVHALPINPI